VSLGIEDAEDMIADFEQALAAASRGSDADARVVGAAAD
jgi:hypothetical protein